MADYLRFEIYLPRIYYKKEPDPSTGVFRPVVHALDPKQVQKFIHDTLRKFQGITQANPDAPAAFKGWWKENADTPVDIDLITYMFGLVHAHKSDEATSHFGAWRKTLEDSLQQKVVLILYYPVQTIGDYF